MKLSPLLTLLTTLSLQLTTTTAHPLETRNVPGILKEFALIGENLILLDKAVKLYEPQKDDKLGLEQKHTNVEISMIKSMNAVHASPPFKKQESPIVANVAVKMQSVWVEYLHDIVVKRHAFEKAKIADRIQEHIRDFKERCHGLAASIEEKLKSEDRETIVDRNRQLDREFDRTIQAFD